MMEVDCVTDHEAKAAQIVVVLLAKCKTLKTFVGPEALKPVYEKIRKCFTIDLTV